VQKLLVVITCALLTTLAQAQVPTLIMPNPLGIILTVGQWIYNGTEKTYYIEVAGRGATPDAARLNGFRLAVEQAVGSVIASETEVNRARITRDEIISYASGFVDKYEITKTETQGNEYQINMKVWIRRSTIANRLLNESKAAGNLEGAKAAVQLSTLQYEREQGDKLVIPVLNDFFRRGFNIELKPAQITFDANRQAVISIPFRLTWNREYLNSLWEALRATAQDPRAGSCVSAFIGRPCAQNAGTVLISTGGFMGGNGGRLGFSDTDKIKGILSVMVYSQPAVQLTVRTSQNQVMHQECFNWSELDHIDSYNVRPGHFIDISGNNNVSINGNFGIESTIKLNSGPDQLAQADQVELKIVPKKQCFT